MVPHLGSFSTVFGVPNFQGRFKALTDVFLAWLDLFDKVLRAPKGDRMQKLRPREVGVSTNHIGAHKAFDVSSYGVRALDVQGFLIDALY
jgi:hypothetical protein